MSVDLKRQASDLYHERDEPGNLRTSEHLSLKKIIYVSLAIMVVALVVMYIFRGSSRRTDPIIAATTPPQVVKEAPPPELLQDQGLQPAPAQNAQPQVPQTTTQEAIPPKPVESVAPREAPAPAPPALPAAAPVQKTRPAAIPATTAAPPSTEQPSTRSTGPRLVRDTRPARAVSGKPAKQENVEARKPAPPPPSPVLSEVELTRRQMAKDIVLESSPALSALLAGPDSKGWQADPVSPDEYNVVFNIVDKAIGTPVQYIWKVNLSTRTVTPLSYYARKLS